jgi:Transmembrane family, TMEM144 of transporters
MVAFDSCGDGCGYLFAVLGALAYGTYGVPIKETLKIPDVHPLVLQSYKTLVMFLLSWLTILLGVSPAFTPWGLLSGLLWVIGGTGGVLAIRLVGMAIAVGTWASVTMATNFIWGILVFHEQVSSIPTTILAFALLTIGLVGMSYYSAPESSSAASLATTDACKDSFEGSSSPPWVDGVYFDMKKEAMMEKRARVGTCGTEGSDSYLNDLVVPKDESIVLGTMPSWLSRDVFGEKIVISRRVAGIAGAVCNGLTVGSSLIPLHYAKEEGFGGPNYMISFATGALLANTGIWAIYYLYLVVAGGSDSVSEATQDPRRPYPIQEVIFDDELKPNSDLDVIKSKASDGNKWLLAYERMPSFYFHQLWLPGMCAGILLAMAMFSSIWQSRSWDKRWDTL